MDLIKRNIVPIILGILAFATLIGVGYYLSTWPRKVRPSATPQPRIGAQTLVEAIEPSPVDGLQPGTTPVITLTLTRPLDPQSITPVWTTEPITQADANTALPVRITSQRGNTILQITPQAPIQANATYSLVLLDKATQQLLYQATYLAATPQPTPVAVNNPALKQFVPYETESYRLSYLPQQNIYVFNFIYNPDLEATIDQQFDDARTQAIQYIQSRGIDSNSVVIDFRHS